MRLGGKVMATVVSAEPLAGPQHNSSDEDKTLSRQSKSSGGASQPRLRIVHSAARTENSPAAPRVDMRPSDRPYQDPDRPPAMLDRTVQAQIGRLLRDVFADVAGEPVPDRFITLLAELETKEKPR
jgi:hypothetical protein